MRKLQILQANIANLRRIQIHSIVQSGYIANRLTGRFYEASFARDNAEIVPQSERFYRTSNERYYRGNKNAAPVFQGESNVEKKRTDKTETRRFDSPPRKD